MLSRPPRLVLTFKNSPLTADTSKFTSAKVLRNGKERQPSPEKPATSAMSERSKGKQRARVEDEETGPLVVMGPGQTCRASRSSLPPKYEGHPIVIDDSDDSQSDDAYMPSTHSERLPHQLKSISPRKSHRRNASPLPKAFRPKGSIFVNRERHTVLRNSMPLSSPTKRRRTSASIEPDFVVDIPSLADLHLQSPCRRSSRRRTISKPGSGALLIMRSHRPPAPVNKVANSILPTHEPVFTFPEEPRAEKVISLDESHSSASPSNFDIQPLIEESLKAQDSTQNISYNSTKLIQDFSQFLVAASDSETASLTDDLSSSLSPQESLSTIFDPLSPDAEFFQPLSQPNIELSEVEMLQALKPSCQKQGSDEFLLADANQVFVKGLEVTWTEGDDFVFSFS